MMLANIVRLPQYASGITNFDLTSMSGLYIHIPYCRSKCAYCDFFSTPCNDDADDYVEAVIKEFAMRRHEIDEPFTTMYLGGGTPSLLSQVQLGHLFEGIGTLADLRQFREVTIEANPEDITCQTLEFYAELGINRVSIGIQSFDAHELESISRRHNAADSIMALDVLQKSGINYSADLIYGLPGQTLANWEANLIRLLEFQPPHFSAYLLSYEPGTRLYARLMAGKVHETDESEALDMYGLLCRMARDAGYRHYEVSNFALPGKEARHNSAYWTYTPYLGLGVSAHSFDGCVRRFNPIGIKDYINGINAASPVFAVDDESDVNRFNDYVITSLRTAHGFDVRFAEGLFGAPMVQRFLANVSQLPDGMLVNLGTLISIPESNWLTSDAIMRELILD